MGVGVSLWREAGEAQRGEAWKDLCVASGSQGSALCLVSVPFPWSLAWACTQRPTLETPLWLVRHWSQSSAPWHSREAYLAWSKGRSRHLGSWKPKMWTWPLGD